MLKLGYIVRCERAYMVETHSLKGDFGAAPQGRSCAAGRDHSCEESRDAVSQAETQMAKAV